MNLLKLTMTILPPDSYELALQAIESVDISHLFAKSVLNKHIDGTVYVDDAIAPTAFYIIKNYGMALLFGSTQNQLFNNEVTLHILNANKQRNYDEWLQVFPSEWSLTIERTLGDKLITSEQEESLAPLNDSFNFVVKNTRVNFKYDTATLPEIKTSQAELIATSADVFEQLNGSVVPKRFWKTTDDFIKLGKGFTAVINNINASTAYSAFIDNNKLEIGIETHEEFKGMGLAQLTCGSLIQYCINRNLEPIWCCRLENQPSYKLAQKLGFTPTKYLPYYRLVKNKIYS